MGPPVTPIPMERKGRETARVSHLRDFTLLGGADAGERDDARQEPPGGLCCVRTGFETVEPRL